VGGARLGRLAQFLSNSEGAPRERQKNETLGFCSNPSLGSNYFVRADSHAPTTGSACDSDGTDSNGDRNADINANCYSFAYEHTNSINYTNCDANIYPNNNANSDTDSDSEICVDIRFR
jgi:hypothetical protein